VRNSCSAILRIIFGVTRKGGPCDPIAQNDAGGTPAS
jgi:hypothetical protein